MKQFITLLAVVFTLAATSTVFAQCVPNPPATNGASPQAFPTLTLQNGNPAGPVPGVIQFRFPSDSTLVIDTTVAGFNLRIEGVIKFDSMDFRNATPVTVTNRGLALPTDPVNASAVFVGTSAANNVFLSDTTNSTPFTGCVDLTYSATAAGQYNVSLTPRLSGYIRVTQSPVLPAFPPIFPGGQLLREDTTVRLENIDQLLLITVPGVDVVGLIDQFLGGVDQVPAGALATELDVLDPSSRNAAVAQAINFQLYPNPATAATVISYTLANATDVNILLTDVNGRVVSNVVSARQAAGTYTTPLCLDCGDELPAGLYIVRVTTEMGTYAHRVVVR